MASSRVPARAAVLAFAAAISALSMPFGGSVLPVAPARAADPVYPDFAGYFTSVSGSIANAGVVNLAVPPAAGPANPDPTSVTAVAGGSALQGAAILRADLAGSPLAETTLRSLRLETLPVEIPLSTIPIARSTAPRTWAELLAPTVLAGIPLQAVTWRQVVSLPDAARPAALDAVTMAEVDWSGSILADLPLAAFTFGGADVTDIDLPLQPGEPASDDTNAERWCYLLNQAEPGSCPGPAFVEGRSLIEIGVRGAPLKNIPLKNIPLKNIDLETSPLKNIPLKNIVLDVAPLKNIPLKNIDLEASPLKNIPLKNILLDSAGEPTASPLKNIPLKNIDWAVSPLKNIDLAGIDLLASPLKNIPLKNIDFGVAPLKNIPLKNIDLAASPLKNIPLKNIAWTVAPLKNIPLKNIDLATSPLKNIPLKNIVLADAPLKNIPLKNIAWTVAPLKNIPLKNIDLAAAGLDAVPLKNIAWDVAPLKNIPLKNIDLATSPLKNIELATTADPAAIAGCAAAVPATCPAGWTLGDVAAGGDLLASATLAAIGGPAFGTTTLADLLAHPAAGEILEPALGDLRLDLVDDATALSTLGALILALVASGAAPAPDPSLDDLRADLATVAILLGDLRLDLVADAPALTLGDLLDVLLPAAGDVLLGDLRLDLAADAPALTLADFIASLQAVGGGDLPTVLLGDLRLDLATGVDALVLDAITAFLIDPELFAPYLLGALGTWTDVTGRDITLGELGLWTTDAGADITLGELAEFLDGSVSLADVLLGLVPPAEFPFEAFPIDSLGLEAPGRYVVKPGPEFVIGTADPAPPGYIVNSPTSVSVRFLNSTPIPTVPVDVSVTLPVGATATKVTNELVPIADPAITEGPDGRETVTVPLRSLGTGELVSFGIEVINGLDLGTPVVDWVARDGSTVVLEGTISLEEVFDGAEPNTPLEAQRLFVEPAAQRVPNLPVNPDACAGADASCLGAEPVYIDTLAPGYISTVGDVDWYRLPDVRAGSRITADLTNLPMDADLVLYGPSEIGVSPTLFPAAAQPLPGSLVEDPGLGVGRAASSIAAQALADLQLDRGWTNLLPDPPEPVAALTPLSISQHRGGDAESVGAVAPVSGDYIVAVSGYNRAVSASPYLLRARVVAPADELSCAPRTFAHPAPAAGPALDPPADANALFLVNPSRMAATHGDTAAAGLTTSLNDLVAYLAANPALGIRPGIVSLDADPAVAAAYAAWDANPCSIAAANRVASEITGVLAGLRPGGAGLNYVTVVGGDDIVPMGRVADLTRIGNQSDYAATFGDDANPLSAAAAASYTLTDDVYGDPSPIEIGNGGSIFVPRIAVGRLVETPTQVAAQLDAFVASLGTLDSSTGFVAGYDFLADGAAAVASRLEAGGRTVTRLIDAPGAPAPWDREDVLDGLVPATGTAPWVASVNAHYDHTALLPSAGDAGTSSELATAADVAARASGGELAGRILFTMGCNAGLAVPDVYLADGTTPAEALAVATLRGDWPQVLSEAGVAVYVANTGYGIGDSATIAYSERLMGLYAKLLDGSLTAGQALVYAKQAYYGSLGAVGVYDLKILQQAAFHGLPFWRLDTSAPAPSAPALPGPLVAGPAAGLQALDLTLAPDLVEVDAGGRGSYWVVAGDDGAEDPQVTHYRPIQPRTSVPVGTAGLTAHGALVTALAGREIGGVDPVLATPTLDLAAAAPEVASGDSAWPARLATVTTSQAPYGRAQDLVVVPGQFLGSGEGGTQRLFDSMGLTVLYAAEGVTDFAAPAIRTTRGDAAGTSIEFRVDTDDAEGPVVRVLVGFRDFDGTWRFVDLAPAGSGPTWAGTAAASRPFTPSDAVEYFVQVVDAAGNVGTASNKAAGFEARVVDADAPSITASVTPAAGPSGWIAADAATVSFTCADTGSGLAEDACPAPVVVTTDGESAVEGTVADRAGNTASVIAVVRLDGTAPVVTASVQPAGWANAPAAVVGFTCSDATSGLAAACPDPVTVTEEGETPVSVTVADVAGNETTVTATVRLDRSAPVITAAVSPAANDAGWHRAAQVTVSFTCADAVSGLPDGACPEDVTIDTDGVVTVTRDVTDRAGNTASASVVVRRDRTDPVVAFTGTGTATACTTTDALSGVATPATASSVTVRVNGIPTTTVTCAGATDVAGNATAPLVGTPYVAPIGFSGFLSPVDGPPVINVGKAGRTYPLKFRLAGLDGAPVGVLPAVTSTKYKAVSCSALAGTSEPVDAVSTSASGLVYDPVADQFTYTWKTPSKAGCYAFTVGLADGSSWVANFNLK